MNKVEFVYTTYIKSTPEKVWAAITNPEFTRQYWGHGNISEWKKGSRWQHVRNGAEQPSIEGEVIESSPPHRLVTSWSKPADVNDPTQISRVEYEIVALADMVKLTVSHTDLLQDSSMAKGVSGGWPKVLSSLKSFLETGEGIDIFAK